MKKTIISLTTLSLLAVFAVSCASSPSGNTQAPFVSEYRPAEVKQETSSRRDVRGATSGMEAAVIRIGNELIQKIPENLTIAVMNIDQASEASAHIVEELKYIFVESNRFRVLDEGAFNAVRFRQRSEEIMTEAHAVSLGQMVGANIVIIVSVARSGLSQTIVVKALDTRTAHIVSMVREVL
jgi:hypothetical protein